MIPFQLFIDILCERSVPIFVFCLFQLVEQFDCSVDANQQVGKCSLSLFASDLSLTDGHIRLFALDFVKVKVSVSCLLDVLPSGWQALKILK